MELYSDDYFMNQAYKEALVALEEGEVPVGAVVVTQNRIIARAYNQTEKLSDTTAHAEMIAITSAAAYLGTKYLKECTLYVTLEPCIMCAGATLWSQLGRVVYGAEDPNKGFMRYGKELLHPKTKVEFGIMSGPWLKLIQDFFEEKRRLKNSTKG